MLAKLKSHQAALTVRDLKRMQHVLVVLAAGEAVAGTAPWADALRAALARRKKKLTDLAETPIAAEIDARTLIAWVVLDAAKSRFEQLSSMRKAAKLLLDENPSELAIAVYGEKSQRVAAAQLAAYCVWLNGVALPTRKSKDERKAVQRVSLFGYDGELDEPRAIATGNTLTRELTMLPPNDLTPKLYRQRVRALAKQAGWSHQEFDLRKLRQLRAGAFVAVAQGSPEEDAAVVRVRYQPRGARVTVALVGKGICFDTGGHNLKPAKYMYGMHGDMNGSAVVLGIMQAAAQMRIPVAIDGWLALAQNHISPRAYKQNDVVTALNGTTIEIIHTDAEGRMVLADTLTLASRAKPDAMVDFATLTGSMHVALGTRYSGVFANRDELLRDALEAGRASGERVCAFPLDADYDKALESKIADVKQCTDDSNADHILAARFLSKFVGDRPWLHMDLSASESDGGLGAVASDVTGFGVAWGVSFLRAFAQRRARVR